MPFEHKYFVKMPELQDLLKPLIKKRGGYKSCITVALNKLCSLSIDDLTKENFLRRQEAIEQYLQKVQDINDQILDVFLDKDVSETDPTKLDEISSQVEYTAQIHDELAKIECNINAKSQPDVVTSKSDPLMAVKLPKLTCKVFDGESTDKLEFKNFLLQFNNCVDSSGKLSDSSKLTYLRSFLSGYAFKVISHLSISDDNYAIALTLLKDEFLDVPYIVDSCFQQILSMSPKFDPSFAGVRSYINECRAIVYELKQYQVNLLDVDSAGCKLLSHIVFSKLPASIKRELVHKVNNNYPSVEELFDNYKEIIQTLIRTSNPKNTVKFEKKESSIKSKGVTQNPNKPQFKSKPTEKTPPSTLENFSTSVEARTAQRSHNSSQLNLASGDSNKGNSRYCKFCSTIGHSMLQCTKFEKVADRQKRCISLGLCALCTSSKHDTEKCPGKDFKLSFSCNNCKKNAHIAALCPGPSNGGTSSHLCINVQHFKSNYQPFLLPVLSITFHGVNTSRTVRCLLDTGSQRSYLSWPVAKELRGHMNMPSVSYDVTTFLGASERHFGECLMHVSIPGGRKQPIAMLADPQFNISLNVSQLDVAVNNIVQEGYTLAEPTLATNGESIPVQGLVGVDILQFIPNLHISKCMLGSAWSTPSGIVPFGNVLHFLHPNQVTPISSHDLITERPALDYRNVVSSLNDTPVTHVNFVLSPKKSYFSPSESLFPDSSVEQGLENMFSLDSLGCHEESNQSQYDTIMIEEFQRGISFKDNRYHVSLPWKENLVEKVPSNHKVALSVLNRVVNNLEQKGSLAAYQEVFHNQLKDGIIEKIRVEPKDFDNYVWIPHRPIFKEEANVTTKIRPVFNCSLKIGNAPSLNEAAYAGLNLMGDIVKLSLYFRSNNTVLLSDIKQAFLQIMLAREEDKNRFCFFMKEGDELVAYRYRTIIFGFNASPFILNYVIKHHASQLCDDEFSKILKTNFYVDNLIVTGNSPEFLKNVYSECLDRMKQGGFCLRSWNSNNQELQTIMRKDESLASHGNNYEKVLGLKYFMESDCVQLSDSTLDPSTNTKRSILSQISKVFDPLGLFLPVTTKGKILMRELWSLKLSWDEPVPENLQREWSKHCSDLSQLSSIPLPRSCANQDSNNSLCIFCDASKSSYGFAIYNVCNGSSQLMFAKSRVAPSKPKTLPMLELLGVYLALKCLPMVLDSFPSIKFQNVTVAVDSQIVLQWLLSESVTTKSIFTRNRIKDISVFLKTIVDDYGISINFKYVKSEDNPCDLITRGLSYTDFNKKLPFWLNGPKWLSTYQSSWPESDLGCLSAASKQQTQPAKITASFNTCVDPLGVETLVDIQKYSDLNKLFRVTSYVLKAVNVIVRKTKEDTAQSAKLYWIKEMQKECFAQELAYLNNSDVKNPNEVPTLVNNLDLFLDSKGVIRSRGRIGKTLKYDFDVLNPVLLAKDHRLTQLIVEFYHQKCKHLGIQTTLNTVRTSGFWIPRMRQVVKRILGLCMTCRRFNNLAFRYPKMTNLPKHRVNFIRPFQHTGIDFTGHLWVKNKKDENVKMYLLIFTCLNVRAIHIELVPDMSTHSFVLAFLRFVNIYGIPTHVYSDNAKSFVAGCQVLERALVCDEFKEHFQCYNVQHIRIPLYSAWVGATWERLIRTVKNCLYKTVGRATLTYFELLTVIGDVQAAINSRPLTYRSSENNLEAITPSCFLRCNANSHLLLTQEEDCQLWDRDPPSRESFISTLSSRDEIFDHFRELWYENYLLSLRENCKNLHERNWENKISAGDVVLVKMLNKTRPYWLLGRVLELIVGHDGKVRSVKLKRGDGVIVHHSINHLYPMELSLTHNHRDTAGDNIDDVSEAIIEPAGGDDDISVSGVNCPGPVSDQIADASHTGARPKRVAATACKDKMRKWCADLSH